MCACAWIYVRISLYILFALTLVEMRDIYLFEIFKRLCRLFICVNFSCWNFVSFVCAIMHCEFIFRHLFNYISRTCRIFLKLHTYVLTCKRNVWCISTSFKLIILFLQEMICNTSNFTKLSYFSKFFSVKAM